MNQQLAITLQPVQSSEADTPSVWVRLEQAELPVVDEFANFFDIYQMLLMANAGLSAWGYQPEDCPMSIDGTVFTVWLDFYSYPSAMDLAYSLSASIGDLSTPILIEQGKEFDLVVTGDTAELPYVASEIDPQWQSRVFDADWREMAPPQVTVEGSVLRLAAPIGFGVLRVRCTAHGYLHTVTMVLDKSVEEEQEDGSIDKKSYRIENLQCAVTAGWRDENGAFQTETLQLEIPPCVEAALAECEGGGLKGGSIKGEDARQIVYYSTCTGTVLMVDSSRVEEDE